MDNTPPTFAVSTGKITKDISFTDHARSVALQADGKVLVAGDTSTLYGKDTAILRYNADGSLDTTFGGSGSVTTDFSSSNGYGNSIAVQADGKILLAGSGGYFGNYGTLARYLSDGTLDSSFGTGGKIVSRSEGDFYNYVLPLSDGRVLVGGSSIADHTFSVTRYLADGTLDASFDGDGIAMPELGLDSGYISSINSLAQQSDGKILATGYGWIGKQIYAVTARYLADGSLDTGFGLAGVVKTSFGAGESQGKAVALQSDGKFIVAGSNYNNKGLMALARYNSDGSLDTSFDGDGVAKVEFGIGSGSVNGIVLQPDGKILVAGTGYNGMLNTFAVLRYNSTGSLDTTFGSGGMVLTSFTTDAGANNIVLQPDSKIVVVGDSRAPSNGSDIDFSIVRYNADGSLDATFGAPLNTLDASLVYKENGAAVVMDANVQVLDAELAASGNYDGASLLLQRHGGKNSQDTFSAKSGGTLSTLTEGSYLAVDSITVGRVTTNSGGVLALAFNTGATTALVDRALQQIAYANNSDTPTSAVQIDWTFSDGNAGKQGSGGARTATGGVAISIENSNDAPKLVQPVADKVAVAGSKFELAIPAAAFADPDGETLSYSAALADGTGLPPWLKFDASTRTFSGMPTTGDSGTLTVRINAADAAKYQASDDFRITVAVPDTVSPAAISFNPAAGSKSAAVGDNITLTFSEPVERGTGNIVLKNAVTGAVVESYDAASSRVSVSGATVVINPAFDLTLATAYTLEFSSSSITDLAGNYYAASAPYTFSTEAAAAPLMGTSGPDRLENRKGSDLVEGGAGLDTMVYGGNYQSYTMTRQGSNFQVDDNAGGKDLLTSVERLQFGNGCVALDISGVGGQAYRIYQAAFGREPDKAGVGYWIGAMDRGTALIDVAESFLASTEFKTLYGASPSNRQFIEKLYENVLHRAGETAGVAYWTAILDGKQTSAADILMMFSEGQENQDNLAHVIGNGFVYQPFG